MKTYSGRLWLVPHPDSKLRVEIELGDETIRITSNDTLIGDWPMSEVTLRSTSGTEARLYAEGEEFVIFTRDADFIPVLAAHMRGDGASTQDRNFVAVRPKDSMGSNVVSFDRDRRARSPSVATPIDEGEAAAVGGGGQAGSADDSSESPRGAHRDDRRMLWRW